MLATFLSEAKGIRFYDVPLANVGLRFCCELEPFNAKDHNSVCLKCARFRMLGHLAKEASDFIAPLLKSGFVADGYVNLCCACKIYIATTMCTIC